MLQGSLNWNHLKNVDYNNQYFLIEEIVTLSTYNLGSPLAIPAGDNFYNSIQSLKQRPD